ncbi:histidinol-phosphatase HisJ family protein [Ornithinibacillus halophilus]|uniref:Histidinol-phosphatase n=1 Tax=Ornithinibacillus halophilus TaxID=930117 RepID=A0A1M5H0W2_9BACI|nr:histidinol-phosphatase HisJ family protein [Ornithinibacillus halophilus]SHG09352.1 histidinol-phosphatase (PHP family) [Ornithinibacillus halophilus]
MFDYHIHSDFSADCDTPMEKTIEKAIELGLKEICFTEHIDYEYPDQSIDFALDIPSYNQRLIEMRTTYGESLKIQKGVEIGVQPNLLDKYRALFKEETFDFIICSMHTTEKKDLHSGSFFQNKTLEEAYSKYYEELLYCVKNLEEFSILGHLDLVKRYTKKESKNLFHDIIAEIFKVIIPRGQGIEINTSGYRYGLETAMPSKDILKLYKECGGEIITIGSDSHIDSTVAFKWNSSLELLDQLGFKYVTTFDKLEPTFHSIKTLR